MHKILVATIIIMFAASASATPNEYTLHQINSTHWYFETTQTGLPYGEHNYQAFANNEGSEYRILIISILRPSTLLEELNLICYEISGEISDINMSNYLVYAFILMGILLIILGIQIITNNIKR